MRSSFFQDRNEPFAQNLLLAAKRVDLRLQVAASLRFSLHLRPAFGLGEARR